MTKDDHSGKNKTYGSVRNLETVALESLCEIKKYKKIEYVHITKVEFGICQ